MFDYRYVSYYLKIESVVCSKIVCLGEIYWSTKLYSPSIPNWAAILSIKTCLTCIEHKNNYALYLKSSFSPAMDVPA